MALSWIYPLYHPDIIKTITRWSHIEISPFNLYQDASCKLRFHRFHHIIDKSSRMILESFSKNINIEWTIYILSYIKILNSSCCPIISFNRCNTTCIFPSISGAFVDRWGRRSSNWYFDLSLWFADFQKAAIWLAMTTT